MNGSKRVSISVRRLLQIPLVLGALHTGESPEFLGSVPWWYKVRLPSGQPAFVSKAWSNVTATNPVAAPVSRTACMSSM